MSYHQDPECNAAIIRLLDALCTWERQTGRGSTLILIPHTVDEDIIQARDGKPIPLSALTKPINLVQLALLERGRKK